MREADLSSCKYVVHPQHQFKVEELAGGLESEPASDSGEFLTAPYW